MLNSVVATDTSLIEKRRQHGSKHGDSDWRAVPTYRLQCRDHPLLRARRLAAAPAAQRRTVSAYETEDVRRLAFVRRARELGFTLDDVRTLLALSADHSDSSCGEVRQLAARQLTDVRVKIADLRAMERALTEAVRCCDAGQLPGCPLIDTLSATAPLHLVSRRRAPNSAPAA